MTVSLRTSQAWLTRSGAAVVISLHGLKEQVSERWGGIRTPTAAKLDRLLRAKLGPSDRFLNVDELHWLVVMPDTEADDALSCCLRIAYELHVSVVPTCDLARLGVSSARMAGENMLELTPLSDEQRHAALRYAGLDELLAASSRRRNEEVAEWRRFKPIWDAHRQIVSGYRCLPDVLRTDETVGQQLANLQAMLTGVARVLEKRLTGGERCPIVVPVPLDVLSTPLARMDFLSTCRQLSCELRPLLVFEIATLGAGMPKHRLAEIVSVVQPFARSVIARVAPQNRTLLDYGGTGLKAIGFDLAAAQSDGNEIVRLYEAGRRYGLASYLDNVALARSLEQGLRRGVQWFSGPAIGNPVAAPAPASRLSYDAIMESLDPAVMADAAC
jgi:hypothetical protein